MVNGIDSLISLSDFSLLIYRNANNFCVLIDFISSDFNKFTDCSNFLIISLGFPMYSIMLSVSSKSFTTSFPIWILLFLFLLGLLWQVLLELC